MQRLFANSAPEWMPSVECSYYFRRGNCFTFLCGTVINTCSIQQVTSSALTKFHHPTLRVALYLTSQLDCNGALNSEHCGLRFTSICYGRWSTRRDRVGWNMFARIGVRLFPRYKWPWLLCPSNRDWYNVQQIVRYVNYSLVIWRI